MSQSLDVTDWKLRTCPDCGLITKFIRGTCEHCGFGVGDGDGD